MKSPRKIACTTVFFTLALCFSGAASAQFATRNEELESRRRDKQARLWPERESPLVDEVNNLVERGLYEGAQTGKGVNGFQLVLGGMRSGQGVSFGAGYRKTDIWRERLGYRGTARMTPQLAYMLDAEVDFQDLQTERFSLDFYTKYESSPQMDFYGLGGDSLEENRSSYLLEDLSADFRAAWDVTRRLKLGFTGGVLAVHTGPGDRSGVPSTDEVFDPDETPGLEDDTTFSRWGAFASFDYLDYPGAPRSGGHYAFLAREYKDEELGKYGFRQIAAEAQQYIPYFNKTRVIAIRVAAALTFDKEDQTTPFYLLTKLGGNDDLRGFQRYRFYDAQGILVSVEHRWEATSALDMAVFVDAGKVASELRDTDFSDLDWSAGIGFRFKLRDAYVMRIDFAGGREGFRFMWTFSDVFRIKREIY